MPKSRQSYFSYFNWFIRYRYDLSIEEAAELGRRAIYHATFRDGASGGVASGMLFFLTLSWKTIITKMLS